MRASDCADDACTAPGFAAPSTLATVLSLSPFILTFGGVAFLVQQKVFPQLSRIQNSRDGEDHFLPSDAPLSLQQAHAEHGNKSVRRRVAAAAFSTTVGLAAVLAELILCEISELVKPHARGTALKITVPTLLFFLVVIIPFLELQTLVAGSGWSFQRNAKGRFPRTAWTIQFAVFGLWLFAFWSLGKLVPIDSDTVGRASAKMARSAESTSRGLARACLERIGIIGISLMALLSGFASVSSPWHTFGSRASRRPVTDSDISRKQAGLDATNEMLLTKRHRLQTLQRKAAETASDEKTGLVTKMLGSFRGGDAAEIRTLRLEIAGLETMEANLASTMSSMRSRQADSMRSSTALGKLLFIPTYGFSLYCVYRILATVLTWVRRFYYPSASFSSSDPINRFLGLLAKHWDPKLDQIAWARQISFLLSGVILAASANSALQTFHLFAKFTPGLLYQAQANLALLIGQISAIYVISAALLMRSNLPKDVGSAVGDALESALEPGFVDRWFEGWFLLASVVTAGGIYIGRKIGEWGEDWEDIGMAEMGQKRS